MTSPQTNFGILTTDERLIVRSWDAWLADITHIPAAAAVGQALTALVPDLAARRLLGAFERVLEYGAVEVLAPALHRYLIPCLPRSPTPHFDHMQQFATIAPLRQEARIVGVMVTIEDVTARLQEELTLAQALASPDENERLRAAETLADASSNEWRTPLLGALADPSWRVRRLAASGLARLANHETIIALMRTLRTQYDDPGVLNSALQILVMSDIDTTTPLIELLDDPDPDLRMTAALALGQQRQSRAIPHLIAALQDSNINVRYHAIESLGQLRARPAVPALTALLDSSDGPPDFFLAFPALDALLHIGDPSIVPYLLPLLQDELLATPAAEALGELGGAEAAAPLAQALDSGSLPAPAAARALARLYDRFQAAYEEGAFIADLARRAIAPAGMTALLAALPAASHDDLRSLALTLGWLEGAAVERALTRLLGQPTARREVIEALVRHGPRVIDLLTEQLAADDLDTRQAAIIALGRIGDERAVPALVRQLHETPTLITVAAGALAKIGDRNAFGALLTQMGHPDAGVRQAIVSALNSLGHPHMDIEMVRCLQDSNPLVREAAVKISGYFGYPLCADLLLAACDDPDLNVRRAALEHIPYLEDDRILPLLLRTLRDPSGQVRAASARALAQVEGSAAWQPLLTALRDRDPWVRYYAARSLGRHALPEALPELARLAQDDPAPHVCAAAIEALGSIGGARVVAILAPLAEAYAADLARAALDALGRVSHPAALPPLLSALASPHPARQLGAVRALALRGGSEAVEALHAAATGQDVPNRLADPLSPIPARTPEIIEAAIQALAQLATPDALAALVALTADPARRESCVAALAQTGENHAELIARGLADAQVTVRCAVVDALARIKRPHASQLLSAALDDPEAVVRLAAVQALHQLGSRRAERQLALLAHSDPDPLVRRAAQAALQRKT